MNRPGNGASDSATEVSIEGSSKTPYAWASAPAVSFTSLPMSAPGFFDALATAGIKILATIADREERGEIYAAVRADIKAGGDAKILNLLAARNQEIQRALREMSAAADVTSVPGGGGELFAAWAAAAGIPPARGSRSVAWR